jgi:DNA-binding transcriptional regulator YhcF (GntR family)
VTNTNFLQLSGTIRNFLQLTVTEMKIWLTKNSEVSVREQLITQITIGIASGDLELGEKLPSTREISRRFQIHANTVSNAYQDLAEQGWLEFRQGSGFYVQENKTDTFTNQLDRIIAQFFQTAQKQGFTLSEINKRLSHFFQIQTPDNFLVIETDKGLREILMSEMADNLDFKIVGTSFENFQQNPNQTGAVFVALFDETAKINSVLPPNKTCIYLKTNSAAISMIGHARPSENDLIAVVSGWDRFLLLAKTMLLAAQIEAESLIIRSTDEPDWQKGLKNASLIICDSLTAKQLQPNQQIRVFHLIADESVEELKNAIG